MCLAQKRQRTGAVQKLSPSPRPRTPRSVLDCASPLALSDRCAVRRPFVARWASAQLEFRRLTAAAATIYDSSQPKIFAISARLFQTGGMTQPLALFVYERLLPAGQLVNRL